MNQTHGSAQKDMINMDSDKKIKHLEDEVSRLKEKEKKLERDLNLYKEIFSHLKHQFEEMKKELLRR